MNAQQVVEHYWQAMASNDFFKASQWLSEDCVIHWPQSKERIHGRDNFARINSEYPAHGRWTFAVEKLIGSGEEVVTHVKVSGGVIQATAITFHTVANGLICRQVEFWPEDYPAPEWRKAWVEYE
ncbi:nuclear transport factor 2 family protein [Vibrio fluvialis]